ncbi:S-adenosyl-L-methionine-dependent methyltransferase [Westerdykella ornata]|uniref:S-adenosyl-L-methionine-dependent methyltransferase n=1 Tax=Westerdykella ornata TaxID=318751 RepID=A0A6A6JHH4_WESOR|nr:S-adenosyl-L-methionine-dependent methyltransferase [Westerdykella ornata]KAF2275665.1 S-adenosyl-L-methionine-dependent methyltransferase [Westerdykella ornata]
MDVSELTKNIASFAASPPSDLSAEARAGLYGAVSQLRDALMDPLQATLRFAFGVHETSAVLLAINMKLFDLAVAAGGPLTVDELAEKASADPLLVRRVLRMLVGLSLFTQHSVDSFSAKPLANIYVTGSPLREAMIHLGSHTSAVARLPEYFAQNGYKNPDDAFQGPWQFLEKTDKHYFDWLADHPNLQHAFNTSMTISRMGQVHWFEFYPVREKLSGVSASDTTLVDIGGGVGHDVVAFRNQFPDIPGKLVFEDLPSVVASGVANGLPSGVEGVGHDFLHPQPASVKGAKIYYMQAVLHDWPDKQARTIIKHIHDVMVQGSILLINENVLPEEKVSLYQAEIDLSMMVAFSSLERTVKDFKKLLESEGLRLAHVYKPAAMTPGAGTVLEFVLA